MTVIQKCCLEIQVNSQQAADELTTELRQVFYTSILPQLEKVIQQLNPDKLHLSIERLTLDLGRIKREQWQAQFVKKLIDQLSKQLAPLIAQATQPGEASTSNTASLPTAEPMRLLEHLLLTGSLPWWASRQASTNISQLLENSLAQDKRQTVGILWRHLSKLNVQQRLATNYAGTASSLFKLFYPQASSHRLGQASQVLNRLTHCLKQDKHLATALRQQGWTVSHLMCHSCVAYIAKQASKTHFVWNMAKWLTQLTASLFRHTSLPVVQLTQLLIILAADQHSQEYISLTTTLPGQTDTQLQPVILAALQSLATGDKLPADLASKLARQQTEARQVDKSSKQQLSTEISDGQPSPSELVKSAGQTNSNTEQQLTQQPSASNRQSMDSEPPTNPNSDQSLMKDTSAKLVEQPNQPATEPLYINHAGLIFLAAFFPQLFTRLKWLDQNKKWLAGKQLLAVSLLHYLASGQTLAAEHELVLAKLLVGIDSTQCLGTLLELPEEVKQAGDDLLQSVINHWKALKNTSVSGLRSAFLQREGRLLHQGENWELMLEQKPYDMLLDQLPWNYKLIKQPWMPQPLLVIG